ncbi:hypothetical protein BJV77DRAFT_966570 [Russula vinacea]|nr:hypothetical protein BJV77DRAFT_966570 [Russula vinacea]
MNKQDGVRSRSDREKTPSRMATFKCTLVQTFCTVRLNYFNSQADGKKLIQFTSDEENVWRSMPELEIPLEIMAPTAFNLHGGTNLPYVSISQAEKGYFIQFTSGMEKSDEKMYGGPHQNMKSRLQGTRWLVGAEITAPAAFNLHGGTNLPYISVSQAEKGYFIQFTSGMEKRNHGTRCLQFVWWYKPSVCNPFHKRNGKKATEKMQSAQELEIPLDRLSFLPIFFPSLLTSETDDDEDIVSVTLPPSQYGWTVVMVKDPESSPRCGEPTWRALAATTKIIGASSASGSGDASTVAPVGPTIDVATIDFGMDALNLEGRGSPHERQTLNDPASHLRVCSPDQRFRVSDETKHLYPPLSIGWSRCCWIIVFRGRDIGVFYDFWARISPLVKLSKGKVISGAHWGKAEGQEDALKKWDAAVEEGIVERIAKLF